MAVPEFMNVGGFTGKRFPEILYPKAVQEEILEYVISRLLASGPPFGPEDADRLREQAEKGQRVYADPRDLRDALEAEGDAGRFNFPGDLDKALEIDRGNVANVVFVRVKGRGYVIARRRDVDAIWEAIKANG